MSQLTSFLTVAFLHKRYMISESIPDPIDKHKGIKFVVHHELRENQFADGTIQPCNSMEHFALFLHKAHLRLR